MKALQVSLKDTDSEVRYSAALALGQLGETTNELLAQALVGVSGAGGWQIRHHLAAYLGRAAQADQAVLDVLQHGLLDSHYSVRKSCAAALAHLGRRFPAQSVQIEARLLQAISDPAFEVPDQVSYSNRTGHDYAQEGLWLLVAGEQRA